MSRVLWVVQVLLAALFLFAGVMKLVMPLDQLAGPVELPGAFIRFIGVVEVLGALGLILPALLRIRPGLTPLAAVGDLAPSVIPLVVGLLAAFVAYGRWRLAPISAAPRSPAMGAAR